MAATRTATGCNEGPAIGFSSTLFDWDATWLRVDSGSEITARGDADKRGRATAVQQFSAEDGRLAGLRPNCVLAMLVDRGDPSIVYDTAGPAELAPQPSFSLRLRGVPERVRSGRTYRLKVALANPGDAPTGRVRVTLKRARGLTAKPRRVTVGSIGPGKARTATIKVRLGARASVGTDIQVRATAGRLDLTAEKRVHVRKPNRPSGGGGGTPSVCTQFFPDISGSGAGSLGLVPCVR